jgi:hypothetical protein
MADLIEIDKTLVTLQLTAAPTASVIEVSGGLKGDKGDPGTGGSGGTGTVTSVAGVDPDVSGDVPLSASDVGALADTYVPDWTIITSKPSTFPPEAHNHVISDTTGLQTALDAKAPLASPTFTGTVSGISKSMVGLGNVDNTADSAKPVSTAQQTALDLKAPLASPTFTGTVSGITAAMVGASATGHTHVSANITDLTTTVQGIVNTQLDIAGAPGTLDTINELAAALGDDANFASTVTTSLAAKAPLASPALTGTPTAPTAITSTNTTQIATTAFVKAQAYATLASPTFTGTVSGITKSMVGLGSVDNTADTAKVVLSAGKWTTARSIAGNSVDGSADKTFANKFIVQGTTDAGLTGAQFLGALGTGIVKNTTTTGVLSIAVAADFPTLNQNTTGSAATLTTARTINGVSFNGSANVQNTLTQISAPTADFAMGSHKFTGLTAGTATGHSVRWDEFDLLAADVDTKIDAVGSEVTSLIPGLTIEVLYDSTNGWVLPTGFSTDTNVGWLFIGGSDATPPPSVTSVRAVWVKA